MSDSKKLALGLIFDVNNEARLEARDVNDAQAQIIATASVTLAINELRKVIVDLSYAADATAGFTSDIAAALVDPEDEDYYDDMIEDYVDDGTPDATTWRSPFAVPIDLGPAFAPGGIFGPKPTLKVA